MKKKKGKTIWDTKYKTEDEEYARESGMEDEPEEHKGTHEDAKVSIRKGEKEADVYSEEGREELVEQGELEEWEEGYVEGAESKTPLRKVRKEKR